MVYSRNDLLMCLTFLSSLKGVASYWFYSSLLRSLHNSEEITEAFLTQYASRWEAKKNNHHLLTIKMRHGDNLKSYIDYFHNQLAKVPNAVKMSLHSRSSVDCKSLTLYTNTCWSMTSLG